GLGLAGGRRCLGLVGIGEGRGRPGLERLLQGAGVARFGLANGHGRLHNGQPGDGGHKASGGGVGTGTSRPNGIHRDPDEGGKAAVTKRVGRKSPPSPVEPTGRAGTLAAPETRRASTPDARDRKGKAAEANQPQFLRPWGRSPARADPPPAAGGGRGSGFSGSTVAQRGRRCCASPLGTWYYPVWLACLGLRAPERVSLLSEEAIMAPQRWAVGGGAALGILVLVLAGRADEAAAVKAVRKLGAEVTVDPKRPGKPVVGVSFIGTEVTDAGLKELKELKSLQSLDLGGTKITDAGLRELKNLNTLQKLRLGFTQVTDTGLKELKELKSLQELDLGRTQITDAGLKELKDLNSLQYLGLYDNRVTNAGLKELRHLKSLQALSLDFTTQVTDAGLKELKELKSLQSLNLHNTQVTDAGVKELKELKNLRELDLRETKVTDAGLKEVKALKNLQELRLRYTQITDVGLKE